MSSVQIRDHPGMPQLHDKAMRPLPLASQKLVAWLRQGFAYRAAEPVFNLLPSKALPVLSELFLGLQQVQQFA